MRTALRYTLLSLGAAMVVFAVLASPAFRPADHAAWAACRAEPTSACLIDLAVAAMLEQSELPGYSATARDLARLGRHDDAVEVEMRIHNRPGDERTIGFAQDSVAPHRLAAALQDGEPLPAALARIPSGESGLYIAALEMLGRNPSGAMGGLLGVQDCPAPRLPPDRVQPLVREMAEAIVAHSASGNPAQRATGLTRAAELYAELGDRDAALEVLGHIDGGDRVVMSFSPRLIRLIGAETALGLYRAAGGDDPRFLNRIAAEEPDATRAAGHLDRAFAAAAGRAPYPDFAEMARTVHVSIDRGLPDLALGLARRLAALADTTRGTFPVFPHIAAAEALMAAGAPPQEVRAQLAKAEAQFPRADQIVGVGAVAGPMAWGPFGLDRQARQEIAALYRRIGEEAGAARVLAPLDDPGTPWDGAALAGIEAAALDDRIAQAAASLSAEDLTLERARLAARLAHMDISPAHTAWARDTAMQILAAQDGAAGRFAVLEPLLRTGISLQDRAISGPAPSGMAKAALASRDARDMVQAGVALYLRDAGCFQA